jgi:hypothetical protein
MEPTDELAIVFRYHRNGELCRNRLELLRRLNPATPIHGIFGGEPSEFADFTSELGPLLASNYCVRNPSPRWKWINGDRILQSWFREEGHRHKFAGIVLTEWDLLILAPLAEVYRPVPSDALGLTGLTDLDAAGIAWNWTDAKFDREIRGSPRLDFWRLRRALGPGIRRLAINLGGSYLPREFLAQYTGLKLLAAGNDEVRVVCYAQAMGFRLVNNGILRRIDCRDDLRYFNANKQPIALTDIQEALRHKSRTVFHPFHAPYPGVY